MNKLNDLEKLETIKELEGYTTFGGYEVSFKSKAQFDWLVNTLEELLKEE